MQLDDLFETHVLAEMDWYDKSPLIPILRQYPNKWVHFTHGVPNRYPQSDSQNPELRLNREDSKRNKKNGFFNVPKIGINAAMGLTKDARWKQGFSKTHNDPPGIYFYPVDFLLSQTDRLKRGDQYGADFPFYYVCDINMAANGINLGNVSWDAIEKIAVKNGWDRLYHDFMNNKDDDDKRPYFSRSEVAKFEKVPGTFLWDFVDHLVQDKRISWSKAFRGIPYIYDPGLGIIHSNEPHQMVVFDTSLIKVLKSGNNQELTSRSQEQESHWKFAIKSLMKAFRAEYGGTLTWKNKIPFLTFDYGNATFTIKFSWHYSSLSMTVEYKHGHAEGQKSFQSELQSMSIPQIVDAVGQWMHPISKRKSDLLFKPAIPIAEAKRLLTSYCNIPLSVKITIENDRSKWRKPEYQLMSNTTREEHDIPITNRIYATVTEETVDIGFTFRISGDAFASASFHQSEGSSVDTLDAQLDELVQNFYDSVEKQTKHMRPSDTHSYWKQFGKNVEADAFMGWVAKNCGCSFNGRIEQAFAKEIATYENFPYKGGLHSDIRYFFKDRRY